MKLAETFYGRAGRAVGLVVVDSSTEAADFLPRDGNKVPAGRPWRSVDQLKSALGDLYGRPKP